MNVLSPITGNDKIEIIENIPVSLIAELYEKSYKIDVSKCFNNISEIYLCKCCHTGYRFYYPHSIAGNSEFYSLLQQKLNYYSTGRWEHNYAMRFISNNDKVLEIGCGVGIFLEKLLKKGINCEGIDFNSNAIDIVKSKGLNGTCISLEMFIVDFKKGYDVVCTFQTLEHIPHVNEFIVNTMKILKKGGKLIIGVPNNNPFLFKYDKWHTLNLPPHHIGLWDKKSLTSLAQIFSFSLLKIKTEPLYDIRYQILMILKHKNMILLKKIVIKIPAILFRFISKTLCKLFDGRNLIAVYQKN